MKIIVSILTSLVFFIPYKTIPNESPTKIISQYLSKISAVTFEYAVKQTNRFFIFFF